MLGGAGPSYYSQRNGNGRPNDEFEGSSFMGHREILAVTSPKRKIPSLVESGKCAKAARAGLASFRSATPPPFHAQSLDNGHR